MSGLRGRWMYMYTREEGGEGVRAGRWVEGDVVVTAV